VKVEISVSEIVEVFKEIQEQPGKIWRWFGPICKSSGGIFDDIMQVELTRFLGRKPMSEWKRKRIIVMDPIPAICSERHR